MLYKVAWGFIHLITGVLESAYLCIDKRRNSECKNRVCLNFAES